MIVVIVNSLLWLALAFPSCQSSFIANCPVGCRCPPFDPRLDSRKNNPFESLTTDLDNSKPRRLTIPPPNGRTDTALAAATDYSEVARDLFGNVITPAALVAGAVLSLALYDIPRSKTKPAHNKLRGIYYIVTLLSFFSSLISVIYAIIATSSLLEQPMVPASSALALIRRDHEVSWVASNLHFLMGLMGFMLSCGLGSFLTFPPRYNAAAAGFTSASLLWVWHIANRTISRDKVVMGNSLRFLVCRYFVLMVTQLREVGGSVGIASVVVTIVSVGLTIRALLSSE